MTDTAGGRSLEEIYAGLPALECKGLCARSCGPIYVGQRELAAMTAARPDLPVNREAPAPARGVWTSFKVDRKLRCPALKFGRCTVYEVRPLICRLWGMAPEMRCMYGCEPERWVEREESEGLLLEISQAGGDPTPLLAC